MNVLELSLVLMLLLFAVLGSGVWIALALALVRIRRRADEGRDTGRASARHVDVDGVEFLGPDGVADVHLDGRNPLSHQIVRGHVRRAWRLGCRNCRDACCT